jgi:proteasome lid subunit RPN8/RPN11
MNNETLAEFKAHAVAEYPREACGFIVVVRGRERFVAARNVAEKPGDQFVIPAEDYSIAADLGEIVAVLHSHPNMPPTPSPADLVSCENTDLEWIIVNVQRDHTGEVVCGDTHTFRPSGYKAPLVGRVFTHGVLDCYALCRDYYVREHGLDIPDFPRDDEWWNKGQNLYRDQFASVGFREITREQLKPGDSILMAIRSPVENHAAIYLGDGLILHHLHGRMSSRDYYASYFQECTTTYLRHEALNND